MKLRTALVLVAATVAFAQMRPEIAPMMKQNAEELRQFTWKRRIEITVKGESKGTRLDQVRFVDGKMESTPLETPQTPSKPFGLRGKIVEKKREDMKEDVERLVALLQSYAAPNSGMLEKASIAQTGPDAFKMIAKGVVDPSDSFTVTWNTASRRPERVEIRTVQDGKPVTATLEYASLPDGVFYPARTVISFPKKDLDLTISSSDFRRVGGSR